MNVTNSAIDSIKQEMISTAEAGRPVGEINLILSRRFLIGTAVAGCAVLSSANGSEAGCQLFGEGKNAEGASEVVTGMLALAVGVGGFAVAPAAALLLGAAGVGIVYIGGKDLGINSCSLNKAGESITKSVNDWSNKNPENRQKADVVLAVANFLLNW